MGRGRGCKSDHVRIGGGPGGLRAWRMPIHRERGHGNRAAWRPGRVRLADRLVAHGGWRRQQRGALDPPRRRHDARAQPDDHPRAGRSPGVPADREHTPQGIGYLASPGGRHPATPFGLIDSGARRATFENPDPDFPQRIIYERRGNELTVRIEGVENDQPKSQEWSWRLSSRAAMP